MRERARGCTPSAIEDAPTYHQRRVVIRDGVHRIEA